MILAWGMLGVIHGWKNSGLYFGFNWKSGSNALKVYALENNVPCAYGGEPLVTATISYEHIVPKSEGGPNVFSNYLVTCVNHNGKRKSQPLRDFLQAQRKNGFKANLVFHLAQMKGFFLRGQSYVDAVIPILATQLNVEEKSIHKAIEHQNSNFIPIAA